MLLTPEELESNVKEIKNSREKIYLARILNSKVTDLRDQLEQLDHTEVTTAVIRGSILQIRELLDYIE